MICLDEAVKSEQCEGKLLKIEKQLFINEITKTGVSPSNSLTSAEPHHLTKQQPVRTKEFRINCSKSSDRAVRPAHITLSLFHFICPKPQLSLTPQNITSRI